jgi:hypothetical protein
MCEWVSEWSTKRRETQVNHSGEREGAGQSKHQWKLESQDGRLTEILKKNRGNQGSWATTVERHKGWGALSATGYSRYDTIRGHVHMVMSSLDLVRVSPSVVIFGTCMQRVSLLFALEILRV